MATLDMTDIFLTIEQLVGEMKHCDEMKRYRETKAKVAEDEEAQTLIRQFQRYKERVEEVERFGHFHPDYRSAKKEAEDFRKKLSSHPVIGAYMEAEEKLDHLLSEVSRLIAEPVSEAIKVPINDPSTLKKRRSCG